ncbi:MAG: YihY/virulence factor BrkB family protein [Gammaproteobacteria bacterium]|nr:YihY/virulence factor BrkB family protein [Gammaproteobacteria bacterium]
MLRWNRYCQELKQTFHDWLDHEGPRLAASLSLYSLLSLAPLIILSIGMTSLAFGRTAAQNAVIHEVRSVMGLDGARTIETIIEHGDTSHAGVASAIGIAVLLFGASGVFGELQSGLNKIWEAQAPAGSGLWALVKSRLVSFALVLGFGFLLVVSLLFSAALAAFGRYLSDHLSLPHAVLAALDAIISFGGVFLLIGAIHRYVPDVRVRWRDVWQGALATAVLFTVGKLLLALYLGKAAVGSAYGAAGSLVVVVLWVYYFAMIFYFGAEFTRVRAARQTQRAALPWRNVALLEQRR